MGFFSWLTADTKKSIPNAHSNREVKTVYLLQPRGKKHIAEHAYQGYGVFGDVDAYVWLARRNAEHFGFNPNGMDIEKLRSLGLSIDLGEVCKDTHTGDFWHIFSDARELVAGKCFLGTWSQEIPELGASANELVENGRFEVLEIKAVKGLPYPLKFSFDEKAVYEQLQASENCPAQGFFYDEH
ncbi:MULTISPECIES: hypothetical protein [Enterobacterales]|uniref:hypothetical protein n=1 Tax=Enterobacterales TaxID=91347 RepID=UPI000DE97475|nr:MULTISPECIES: hypothetical protein [Enterobacterales]EKZ5942112.1 hypothetical protein [Klebsiella pneumoniae]HBZ8439421.1 hypothetical protein [Klebsiella aerogenes]HDS7654875.1 hypothetical protein [Klebsiella variicola]HEJ2447395.1 hypothetical protein [Vibrio cholerae]MBV6957752.1 hypothetical protein [Escherichia coli]